jgi:ABC-type transport system involved in cytochrome bd biosynthesis fused ATPase/permease subunit
MKSLRVLGQLEPNTPWMLLNVGALGVFGAVVTIVQVFAVAQIIGAVVFRHSSLEELRLPFVLALLATVLRFGLLAWRERISSDFAVRAVGRLRDQITQSGLRGVVVEPTTLVYLLDALGKLEAFFARVMPSMVLMLIVPSVILVFTAWLDWLTALIFLLTAPLIPLLMWLIGVTAKEHTEKQYHLMQQLGTHFMDVLRGLEDLQALNRSKVQQKSIQKASDGFAKTTMQALQVAFLNGFAMELIATIATALVAVSSGVRLLQGQLPFEVALCSIVLAPEFFAPIRQFGLEHHTAMEAEPVAQSVLAQLEQPRLEAKATDVALEATPMPLGLL